MPPCDAVNLLDENGFATGFSLAEEVLMELQTLCDGAVFSADDEPGAEFCIKLDWHEAPAQHSVYRTHNPHETFAVVAKCV